MLSAGFFRVERRTIGDLRILPFAGQVLASFISLTAITGCLGSHKPVATPHSQTESVPPPEFIEPPQSAEPTLSEPPVTAAVPVPVPTPPIVEDRQATPEERADAPVVDVKPVYVVAQRESYTAANATSGTKTDTSLMETPLNVQVIAQQVLKDQQVIKLEDALRNVSGVTTATNLGSTFNTGPQIFLRGFTTNTLFRNGFRMDQPDNTYTQQFANVERLEVLKGPAAILYGRVEPGGMVNVITKQPLATPYYAVSQQFGSYNLYRTSVDATGPLTKDDTLLYRVNMSYQRNDSFRDLVDAKNVFLAPVLKWNISPRTQATVELEYQNNQSSLEQPALPFVDAGTPTQRFVDLPRHINLNERNPLKAENMLASFNWSHRFDDDWSIKQQVTAKRQSNRYGLRATVQSIDLSTSLVDRFASVARSTADTYSTNLDVTGHFRTGALQHTLLLGADYYRFNYHYDNTFGAASSFIDLFNPIHPGPDLGIDPSSRQQGVTKTDNYGLYVQDQITLPHHVHLMGGLRYQYIHATDGFSDSTGFTPAPTQNQGAVTPRVGILWQPQPWVSLYSNYTENFGSNGFQRSFTGIDLPGKVLGPTSAKQWEVGVKTEFFNGRLRATLAYYDLTKTNVATPDLAHPFPLCGGGCVLAIGEARSKGPELDIQGEIIPGWSVIATYTNQDVRITKSNDPDGATKVGNRLEFVPRNVGTVWTTYEVQQGPLERVKLGGGVTMQDGSYDAGNTFRSKGYAVVGLMSGYSFMVDKSKVTAQLNIYNLLDKTYLAYASPQGNFGFVTYSTPRTFLGSITVEY